MKPNKESLLLEKGGEISNKSYVPFYFILSGLYRRYDNANSTSAMSSDWDVPTENREHKRKSETVPGLRLDVYRSSYLIQEECDEVLAVHSDA